MKNKEKLFQIKSQKATLCPSHVHIKSFPKMTFYRIIQWMVATSKNGMITMEYNIGL